MPIPTKGFNAPPSATGAPYPRPIVQVGDPGAVGPGTWWVNPLTGAEAIRNDANTGWIATSGSGAIPNIGQVLTAGADAAGLKITNLADPTGDQDAATKDYVDDAIPGPATTVTGPDTPGDPAVVGVGTTYARDEHDHGLTAAIAGGLALVAPFLLTVGGGAIDLTARVLALGPGTVTASIVATVSGPAFLNIYKNIVLQEQLTASSTGTFTFSPFAVIAGDQVYMTGSNGGSVVVTGGAMALSGSGWT